MKNLIILADIKEYLPQLDREEITTSRFAEILNQLANERSRNYIISEFDAVETLIKSKEKIKYMPLFNLFKNSILAVFFTALIPLLLSVFDFIFFRLVLLILCCLPLLLVLDFCLWIIFYKNEIEEDFVDLDLLIKALNEELKK